MKSTPVCRLLGAALSVAGSATALTIAEINGNKYNSPYDGKTVQNVTGLVTATSDNGIYLRSLTPDSNPATGESLYVFNSDIVGSVSVGDVINLDGKVTKYRANKNYIYLNEFTNPANLDVLSSGNDVRPLVIGVDTLSPPTELFSSLDQGGIFGVPNAVTKISEANPALDPTKYGLDFWQSLVGELVTVKGAYLTARPNKFGDVWVRGDYKATGVNAQGGITMLQGDANPEAILIGSPLDGSKNPTDTKMGDFVGDVTGVVSNAFGFYRILPLTKVAVQRSASADYGTASFTSAGDCSGLTIGDYNAENLMPNSAHMPKVIDQIVHKLLTPDLIFLQEIQDNSGSEDDGTTSANVTLSTLTKGIESASGIKYAFADVDPEDGMDGGQPGGNIRCAYLYRTDTIQLYKPKQGGSTDANDVVKTADGPELTLNPGRIDPSNEAFANTRKPLAAMWKTIKDGKVFFTVNVHQTSKGGSTTLHADARPPLNKGVEKRTSQNEATASFIAKIISIDSNARVITAGDFNEFAQVQPMTTFASKSGLTDLDEVAGIEPTERYTYQFDMNSEALDHIYVSAGVGRDALYQHLHLNTWQNFEGQTSDHDPSVAKLNVCGPKKRRCPEKLMKA